MGENIKYDLAHYDGGLPGLPESRGVGTLTLTSDGKLELRFKGTRKRIGGVIATYRFEADDLDNGGCEVTIREKDNPSVAAVFDLTDVSADAFLGELALRGEETAALAREQRAGWGARSRQQSSTQIGTGRPRTVGDVLLETPLSTATAFVGFLLVAAGSVGPWIDTFLGSVGGLRVDGRVTLGAAAVGIAVLAASRGRAAGRIVAGLAAAAALVTAGYDFIHIRDAVSGATLFGHRVADAGWGPIAVVGGAAIALAALLFEAGMLSRTPSSRSQTR